MAEIVSSRPKLTGRVGAARAVRPFAALVAICSLAFALGACSKCDVPDLLPHQAGPQSCHDTPALVR